MRIACVQDMIRRMFVGLALFALLLLSACATRQLKSDLLAVPPEAQPKFWAGCTEIVDAQNPAPHKQTFQCSDVQGRVWILSVEKRK